MQSTANLAAREFHAAMVAGAVVVLLAIALAFFYPPTLATLPQGFHTPILAIEFVASLAEAEAIFAGDADLVQQVQTGHRIDMAFLLAYGAFLLLLNLGFWRWQRRPLNLAGALAAVIAAVADSVENLHLLQLGEALRGNSAPPDFAWLRVLVASKFIGIAVSLLCLGHAMWHQGRLGKLFACISIVLAPISLGAITGNGLMMEACGLLLVAGWVCLLAWLVRMRKLLVAPGHPQGSASH